MEELDIAKREPMRERYLTAGGERVSTSRMLAVSRDFRGAELSKFPDAVVQSKKWQVAGPGGGRCWRS